MTRHGIVLNAHCSKKQTNLKRLHLLYDSNYGGLVARSCLTLVPPWTLALQAVSPWDSPGKNTEVGCHFILQGLFLTQGLNLCLLLWQVESLPLSHLESLLVQLDSKYRGSQPGVYLYTCTLLGLLNEKLWVFLGGVLCSSHLSESIF